MMLWQMMTTLDHLWLPPPVNLALPSDEVHVWRASLDQPASRVQSLQHTLTTDELSQAGRFYFQKDRQHFIVARGLLRAILSRYLDVEPGQLRFCYSDYGKPSLAPPSGPKTLNFNLSHSDRLVLYAVTRGREIGIDLERVRPVPEAEQIAERFFSAEENAVFRTLPARLKQEAFFTCWTRKEAYIKARGEGLSLPLDQFDVSLVPGEPAMLLSTRGDPQEAARWSLRELMPGPGYVAAIAVEGHDWRLACWQFPESNQYAGTSSVRMTLPRS
jgi:4'-phosphopantetheinyl transferase